MPSVLIVEDNRDIACLYERIFASFQTCVVLDIPEALGYLQQACPDLIILDFHLPSGSGLHVLKYVRSHSRLKNLPVLGISGDDLLKDQATQEGIDAFLNKPFRIVDLSALAHQLLSRSRKAPSQEMLVALKAYTTAYQRVYNCPPHGQWTGNQVLVDGQVRDEAWFRAETRRLYNATIRDTPRSYLYRLIDKLRRL